MKQKEKNKINPEFTDILNEFNFFDAEPSKKFEDSLKNKFLKASLPQKSNFSFFSMRKLMWLSTTLIAVTVLSISGIVINFNNRAVLAQTFENIYAKSSQSALMPVFAKLKKLSNTDLDQAMNISALPLQKDTYGTATTTVITYGSAYDDCAKLFKFDKSISKTITFESYKNNSYRFKTHVFDQNGTEIELLLSDGERYFSQKQDKTLGSGVANFNNIDAFIPENLYKSAENEIIWEDSAICNDKEEILKNKIAFTTEGAIETFEITKKDSEESIYKASFEIKRMTDEELVLVDELFRVE